MRNSWRYVVAGMAVLGLLLPLGCSESSGPDGQGQGSSVQGVLTAVSLDRAQLAVSGVTSAESKAIFSVGWKKFVGPNITEGGTIGEAYAIARSETVTASIHPTGLDMGTVSLAYAGGSLELKKFIAPNGGVVYGRLGRGFHDPSVMPVNIPFVPGGVYTFSATGSDAFSAGTFQVTAPASLLAISNHANGDTVSAAADLTIKWTGGSGPDSVLVRIVPHLRPEEAEFREGKDTLGCVGDHFGGKRPMGHRHGGFMEGGPLEAMGPEFSRGIVVMIPNTGSITVSAADMTTLLGGIPASELMVGVTQVAKQEVVHDGGKATILLRNGDRVVLRVK
jgi:hypothetical protein